MPTLDPNQYRTSTGYQPLFPLHAMRVDSSGSSVALPNSALSGDSYVCSQSHPIALQAGGGTQDPTGLAESPSQPGNLSPMGDAIARLLHQVVDLFKKWFGSHAPSAPVPKPPVTPPSTVPKSPVASPSTVPQGNGKVLLSPEQKRRAELLTSVFENSSLELQYGYAEALGDGRGITAGRAGFCSGTGDMLEVVRRYTRELPNNPLARFLPRLEAIDASDTGKDSVQGLEGLEAAWKQAATDPRFCRVQDDVVDALYFQPAMGQADTLGLTTPLARAQLYDAIIQHGNGSDPDGLPALIAHTNQMAGGSPATGINESTWLKAFLAVRRADLAHANDPTTRKAWAESVSRVDAYSALLTAGNLDLHGPIQVTVYGDSYTVP